MAIAENHAQAHDQYRIDGKEREPIDRFVREHQKLLILTRGNNLARALRSFFGRSIPLWEGHRRDALEALVKAVGESDGKAEALARASVTFMGDVGVGFTASAFGDRLVREAADGCRSPCRGKPALIQELARCIVTDPSHRGVSRMLKMFAAFRREHNVFREVKLDHQREFWEGVRLGDFDTAEDGLAEITHRRGYSLTGHPHRGRSEQERDPTDRGPVPGPFVSRRNCRDRRTHR